MFRRKAGDVRRMRDVVGRQSWLPDDLVSP